MRTDVTSMFFNSSIEGKTATPAWGTSIGQSKQRKCRIDAFKPEVVNMLVGMTYKSITDTTNLDISKGSAKREILLCSQFTDVFVNGEKVENTQYVLLLVREHSESHEGRLIISYAPYIKYNGIANQECINKMQKLLHCKDEGCWFVYDISIEEQSTLHFKAIVVDADKPKIYDSSKTSQYRSAEWNSMIPEEYKTEEEHINNEYRPYITAIKSKPFLLLAGISGTGKSRIVRELARACWKEGTDEYKAQKPKNFQMVQVKPNWHDSSDLIGYVSRVSGKAEFVAGEFLKFIAKAWEDTETPYFLCLDEMNLAPVEQYFAEYLSVIESRKSHGDGIVTTDPILEKADEEWYFNLTASLTSDEDIRKQFNEEGISIPQNLIVVGTVNMDETTFSFSRKVLDRAMTIEMNEVDLHGGLTKRHESIGKLSNAELVGSAVEGVDVYNDYTNVCDIALGYLQKVNDVLEGTPFKVAYRTRNEFLLYVVNNLPYCKDENGNDLEQGYVTARALDEITCMKVLSRIEGDDTKVSNELLDNLSKAIEDGLKTVSGEENTVKSISLAKLKEMKAKLVSGYTSFWS